MQWYYALNGQRLGPVSHEEFVKLVTDGIIKGDTLVWSQGMPEWRPYAVVSGVSPGAPAVDDGTEMCAVSGKRYPRSQMINHGGKWISAEHRDAYFQRVREGVSQQLVGDPLVPGPFGYGGFWRRFCAYMIDSIIVGGVFMVLAMFAGVFFSTALRGATRGVEPSPAVLAMVFGLYGVVILVALFYHSYLTYKYGATWGKMAMGLKVVRADGSSLSFARSLGRIFAHGLSGLVMNIGYIIAAFDQQKRALHDHVCDTRVIKTR